MDAVCTRGRGISLFFTLLSHPFRLQSSSSSFDTLFPLYSNFSRRQDRSRLSYSFDYRRVYVPSLLLFIDKEFRRFDEGRFISELYPSSSPTESLLFLPPARIKASWLGNFCAHIRTETPRGGTDGQSSKGGEEGKGRRNRRQLQRTIPSFSRIFEIFPLKKLQAPVPRFFFPRRQQQDENCAGRPVDTSSLSKYRPSQVHSLPLSLSLALYLPIDRSTLGQQLCFPSRYTASAGDKENCALTIGYF